MSSTPSTVQTLQELLVQARAELSRYLEAGQPAPAEAIFSKYPALVSDPAVAVDLIVCEFQLRRGRGEQLDPSACGARFPQWRHPLERCLTALVVDSQCSTVDVTVSREPPTVTEQPQVRLDHLEMLRELGRGGMGIVYEADDPDLDRRVALKMIRDRYPDAAAVERFRREARILARLRHPNIVEIFAVGVYKGQPCYTMPLLTGSVSQLLASGRQEPRQAAALMEKVARAVHAAHVAGVIHRDLKPGNILLDKQGEPLVADFGLAKLLNADTTLSAGPLGTPAYMAPEQTAGGRPSEASDIWSLGVILHELLAGRRLFEKHSSEAVLRITPPDPALLRALQPQVAEDLQTVVFKCLEMEPALRYASAGELADDLGRWLRGEPIQAHRPSWYRRTTNYLRQRRQRLLIGALVLLLVTMPLAAWFVGHSLSAVSPPPNTLTAEERQRQQALTDLNAELDSGAPVTLLDNMGRERWYRWATEKGRSPLLPPQTGYRPLSGDELCQCELLPEPRSTSYRFSAQVRLPQPRQRFLRAGLYFLAEELPTPDGCLYRYLSFELAQQGSEAILRLRLDHYHEPTAKSGGPVPPYYFNVYKKLSLKSLAEWHTLAVQVSADNLTLYYDNEPPLKSISAAKLDQARKTREKILKVGPFQPLKRRGSLGLLVAGGEANFRSVTIQRLSPK